MKPILLMSWMLWLAVPAMGETIQFSQQHAGSLPAGWACGVTGQGTPKWAVEADPSASAHTNVLRQSGAGDFPWCVNRTASIADGYVEARFKPVGGREDQAGGVVWRWKDSDNYYIARANALENNVSLYYTSGGRRHTIQYREAPVAAKAWHTLRVDFVGNRIQVTLDGKRYIDVPDDHITGTGAVGVWTKADSETLFETVSFGSTAAK